MSDSYLYAIGPYENGPIKIGFSKTPDKRLKTLQTGHPETLYLHKQSKFSSTKIRLIERLMHKEYSHRKTKGEWFNMKPEEAIDFIEHMRILHEDTDEGTLRSLTK